MSKTGITSYERVYQLLLKTNTCQDIWKAALRDLDQCKIEQVKWRLRQGTDTSEATPEFYFTGGFSWREHEIAGAYVSAGNFLTDELCRKVLDIHFGSDKDVKTFNCRVHIVREGGYVNRKTRYGREQEYQRGFIEWLQKRFTEEAGDKLVKTADRLRALVSSMEATEEFAKTRREALISFCKNDITKALLPWHGMDQQTLQDAWDQFICTAIMHT